MSPIKELTRCPEADDPKDEGTEEKGFEEIQLFRVIHGEEYAACCG